MSGETVAAARRRRRSRIRTWASRLALLLLALPKALSLLVPRRPDLILIGARGAHPDNLAGILTARPGPPPGLRIRVLVSRRNRADGALVAAVSAVPGARFVDAWTLAAVWLSLRAGWVLVSNLKHEDAWPFWLGRARLVYCNHGAWIKRMAPAFGHGRKARIERWLFGRFEVVLASSDEEVADYQQWFGTGVRVICLGYPRSPLLDATPLSRSKVGLWPTWKPFPDPGYGVALAEGLHRALDTASQERRRQAGDHPVTIEYRPHALTGETGATLGPVDPVRPFLVVTDFSSVAFDQAYLGGRVLLFSRCLETYLAQRGVRPAMEPWLRQNVIEDPAELTRRVRAVLAGRDRGVPDPLKLRPFDSQAFWALLEQAKR